MFIYLSVVFCFLDLRFAVWIGARYYVDAARVLPELALLSNENMLSPKEFRDATREQPSMHCFVVGFEFI